MVFLRKYIPALLAIVLLAYYLIIAWVLHRSGYEHSESLFLAEKARLLFEARDNTLLTLGTTFPSLVYLSTVVFSIFGYPFAPILASATFTSTLFFLLIIDFSKSSLQRRFFIPMLILLFFFHPGLIFSGTSGRGIALLLLFFYLMFRSLFTYYKTQTTFSLSMASIYLTCLVFCNYNFIWLLLGLLPFVVLVSLDGLKTTKYSSPIVQYYESVNNRSQRRKLTNRTLAIYIILFALPLGAVYLFKLLNQVHAGNGTYFLTSQYANWSVTGTNSLGEIFIDGKVGINALSQTQIVFQGYLLLLTPLLILVFVMFKGKLYELLTLIAPFILIGILLLDNQVYLTVEYYLIFLVLALIGVHYYSGKKYTRRSMYPIIMFVALVNIYTGILYFKRTSDIEEQGFFAGVKKASKWNGERVITEEYQMATYITGLMTAERASTDNGKILMDDAAAYPIIAQMRKLGSNIILPINHNFITVSENPMTEAKYICIAKKKNRLRNFTVLNQYNLDRLESNKSLHLVIMFETENWAVYRLDNINKAI
ncbi:MAG: hypothetical protein ACOVO1_01010 [Chitinophagaceae bacterium]